jgi:hypothetical protein
MKGEKWEETGIGLLALSKPEKGQGEGGMVWVTGGVGAPLFREW